MSVNIHPDAVKAAQGIKTLGQSNFSVEEIATIITRVCKLNEYEAAFRIMVNKLKDWASEPNIQLYPHRKLIGEAQEILREVERIMGKE
jgi:hypothetical protein